MADDRNGNPSDPAEEAERIRKAYENVDNWERKYGAEFSGSVSMKYGDGPVYRVPIGNPELAQKVASRPIPKPSEKILIEAADAAPCHLPLPPTPPRSSWLARLINRIMGAL